MVLSISPPVARPLARKLEYTPVENAGSPAIARRLIDFYQALVAGAEFWRVSLSIRGEFGRETFFVTSQGLDPDASSIVHDATSRVGDDARVIYFPERSS